MLGAFAFGQKAYGQLTAPFESGSKLLISGIDRSGLLQGQTLRIRESTNARSTMSFKLVSAAADYRPTEGEEVAWINDGVLIFKGSIEDVSWTSGFSAGRFITCNCVNLARALDRRLVARAFENLRTDQIVQQIIDLYLDADGITAGTLDTGPLITKAIFNYVTAAKAMDDICDLTGYTWYVDQYGQLHVRNRATVAAPWDISDGSKPVYDVQVKRSRAAYANTQWLRAGQGETDERTESFKGDDERQTFTLKYPAATAPTVTVNGTPKTVGIRALDVGKDFYWQKGDRQITQDDAATSLSDSDVLAVTYTGFYPLMIKVQNDAEIDARQLIENNSGIYERIDADEAIEDLDLATDKANGLLRKFSEIQEVVTYGTYDFGIRAGQLQNIDLTLEDVDGDYLIAEVTISWSAERNGYILQARALSGEQLGGWQAFFKRLFQSGNKFTLRENEVILSAIPSRDTLTLTDEADFGDPVDDGSDDPFTTAWVSDPTQDVGHQFRVGKSRVGRDYFS